MHLGFEGLVFVEALSVYGDRGKGRHFEDANFGVEDALSSLSGRASKFLATSISGGGEVMERDCFRHICLIVVLEEERGEREIFMIPKLIKFIKLMINWASRRI